MYDERLTRDNPLLSRLTMYAQDSDSAASAGVGFQAAINEINFTTKLPADVAAYVEQGLSDNTRRAYVGDLAHFQSWGGTIPASDTMVASYLAEHAESLTVATLVRRLATISKAHTARGLTSPTSSELVKATMRGIKRSRGTAQKEAKPLLRDDLFDLLERMGNDTKAARDRALLLIGFAGGFRRSELIGLNVEDIDHVRQGIIITLHRSKTDQEGAGRNIGIPLGRTRWCPVGALNDWLSRSGLQTGPLFRPVSRHGHIHDQRLSGEAVSLVVRERVSAAGMDPTGYSGHSLRAGFATSAAMAGASTWKIRAQTGHASDAMLSRYIRDGGLFESNAAGLLV